MVHDRRGFCRNVRDSAAKGSIIDFKAASAPSMTKAVPGLQTPQSSRKAARPKAVPFVATANVVRPSCQSFCERMAAKMDLVLKCPFMSRA